MGLSFNSNDARKADKIASVIRETGKYIGVITRAEKLLSKNSVEGVGLSFKTDDDATANYLDVYTIKADGTPLRGQNLIQALLCCLRLKDIDEGEITFDKWDGAKMSPTTETGYPDLMGKRIGMILQVERQEHSITGADVDRMNIVLVFEASTGLTASEILDGKTKAEKVNVIEKMVLANPIRDTRKNKGTAKPAQTAQGVAATGGTADFDDSIPF